jgi:hypothetical protein
MQINTVALNALKAEREKLVAVVEKAKQDPVVAARRAELQAQLAALDNTDFNTQLRSIDRAIKALENPNAPGPGKGQTLSPEHRQKIKDGLKVYNTKMKQLKADAKNTPATSSKPIGPTTVVKGKGKPGPQPGA